MGRHLSNISGGTVVAKKKDYLWSKSIVDVIKNKDNIPKNGEENVNNNTYYIVSI